MKIRIRYRVHGVADSPLLPGQVVDLDEEQALALLRQGAAEELEVIAGTTHTSGAAELEALRRERDDLRGKMGEAAQEIKATGGALDALLLEKTALKQERDALQKQVEALQKAVQKAKAKPSAAENAGAA